MGPNTVVMALVFAFFPGFNGCTTARVAHMAVVMSIIGNMGAILKIIKTDL